MKSKKNGPTSFMDDPLPYLLAVQIATMIYEQCPEPPCSLCAISVAI